MEIEFYDGKVLTVEDNYTVRYPIKLEFGDTDEKLEVQLSKEQIRELVGVLIDAL